MPQSYIDAIEHQKETNPSYYRIYALGEFCSLDKLIFNNWRLQSEGERVPPNAKLLVGLDFGYVNDPSALVISYLDEANKKLYVVDEVYKKGLLNDAIAALIKNKLLQKEVIIADSAEQKSIDEIKRLGVPRIRPAAKGQGSVLQGIQKLQQLEIIVAPKCENVITELQNYAWRKDKSSGEYINEPQDSFNHTLDALRYSLQVVEKPTKLQTLTKSQLGL